MLGHKGLKFTSCKVQVWLSGPDGDHTLITGVGDVDASNIGAKVGAALQMAWDKATSEGYEKASAAIDKLTAEIAVLTAKLEKHEHAAKFDDAL